MSKWEIYVRARGSWRKFDEYAHYSGAIVDAQEASRHDEKQAQIRKDGNVVSTFRDGREVS